MLTWLFALMCLGSLLSVPVRADTPQDHFNAYVAALRATPGALSALNDLTGVSIPATGDLTPEETAFIYEQLFDSSGNPTLAYTNPTLAAQAIPPADTYLQTLRSTTGGLDALQTL